MTAPDGRLRDGWTQGGSLPGRSLLIVAVAPLLVLAGGCARQDAPEVAASADPARAIAVAMTATRAAGTARVAITAAGSASDGSVTRLGRGVIQFTGPVGRGRIDTFQTGSGSLAHLTAQGPLTVLFDEEAIYERYAPHQAASETKGRPWGRIDLRALGAQGRLELPLDPGDSLAYLPGAVDVRDLGAVRVRDEPARHYQAVLDPVKASASLPAARRRGFLAQARASGGRLAAEVWLDAQGRLRKLSYQRVLPPPAPGRRGELQAVAVTLEFFDFGTPVRVDQPPASEVADITAERVAGSALGG